MKLGMVDYVQDPTPHDNFGGGSAMWVVCANMWLVTSLSFFSFFSFLLFSARAQVVFQTIGWYKCASLHMWFVISYYHKIFIFAVL